ncbi:hypothetical protein HKBW3S06_00699 [Candidatus Hakubella thermalkaliphila]|uniref:N-acetyltransferase domain-containing protein n=1 Tax=Candidatus Hakubella thermalkaliphila TaxID=2754717 RepID=A0A6V8NMB8_9ACTN|nr:hypothetical protein [Candidatus Hakubella thermalkaliphila]GFP21472.1 hypothetical protein HKBW3S06_00699 [Candidatus Hakubella thermalkaliphila]
MIDKLEAQLRPPATELPPYPPKFIMLASGEKMVIRQAKREEVPFLLEVIRPLISVERDFYDLVAARMYAELLGWYRYRVKDEYCIVGAIDGVVAGIVNGRSMNPDQGMSYHTIAIKRGLRVGGQLFAAKMEYHIEIIGHKEVFIVAESPIGFRRWILEFTLEPRPEVWHELGGVPTYVLTDKLWYQHKARLVAGRRPVPEDLLKTSKNLKLPSEYSQLQYQKGGKT